MKRRALSLRDIARMLTLPWAAWWVYFAISATCFIPNPTIGDYKAALVALAVFTFSAGLVWRYEVPGAILLLIEGIAVSIGYPLMGGARMPLATSVFVIATLGGPPLVSGATLLWLRFSPRHRKIA